MEIRKFHRQEYVLANGAYEFLGFTTKTRIIKTSTIQTSFLKRFANFIQFFVGHRHFGLLMNLHLLKLTDNSVALRLQEAKTWVRHEREVLSVHNSSMNRRFYMLIRMMSKNGTHLMAILRCNDNTRGNQIECIPATYRKINALTCLQRSRVQLDTQI